MALSFTKKPETFHEPDAAGDPMGTPAADEKVLWKGKPDVRLLARTAFHTRTVGLYFAGLVALSIYLGNSGIAVVMAALGVLAITILYSIAWFSARTTLYIITDARLIMRIGMAIETRINMPLKQVISANLRPRGKDHGDIALTVGGDRLLGYVLLWPHARPWRINRPEPMLRAIPEARKVAQLLADARAQVSPIARGEATAAETASDAFPPKSTGSARPAEVRPAGFPQRDFEGATA